MPAPKQISPRQMEMLIDFMESNRAVAVGQLINNGPLSKHQASDLWDSFATSLNSLGEGVTKSGAKWRSPLPTTPSPPPTPQPVAIQPALLSPHEDGPSTSYALIDFEDQIDEIENLPPVFLRRTAPTLLSGEGRKTALAPPVSTAVRTATLPPPVSRAVRTPTLAPPVRTAARTPTLAPPVRTPSLAPPVHTAARTPTLAPPVRTPSLAPPVRTAARTPTLAPPVRTPSLAPPVSTAARTPTLAPPVRTPSLAPPVRTAARTPTLAPPVCTPTLAPPVRTPTLASPVRTVARTPTLVPPVPTPSIAPPAPADVDLPPIAPPTPSASRQQPSRRRRTVEPAVPQWALQIEERRLQAQEQTSASLREMVRLLTAVAADIADMRRSITRVEGVLSARHMQP